jgi:hypothetical protein
LLVKIVMQRAKWKYPELAAPLPILCFSFRAHTLIQQP